LIPETFIYWFSCAHCASPLAAPGRIERKLALLPLFSSVRERHLLLDEQADQLFAMTDPIAERVRKLGGSTLKSIGHISRTQRVLDNNADYVNPLDMLAELREDNKMLAARLREAHNVCEEHRDIATASLIEVWIDETERRTWFLFEASRNGDTIGR
jgi:starvation-inducible DNA-binding protein